MESSVSESGSDKSEFVPNLPSDSTKYSKFDVIDDLNHKSMGADFLDDATEFFSQFVKAQGRELRSRVLDLTKREDGIVNGRQLETTGHQLTSCLQEVGGTDGNLSGIKISSSNDKKDGNADQSQSESQVTKFGYSGKHSHNLSNIFEQLRGKWRIWRDRTMLDDVRRQKRLLQIYQDKDDNIKLDKTLKDQDGDNLNFTNQMKKNNGNLSEEQDENENDISVLKALLQLTDAGRRDMVTKMIKQQIFEKEINQEIEQQQEYQEIQIESPSRHESNQYQQNDKNLDHHESKNLRMPSHGRSILNQAYADADDHNHHHHNNGDELFHQNLIANIRESSNRESHEEQELRKDSSTNHQQGQQRRTVEPEAQDESHSRSASDEVLDEEEDSELEDESENSNSKIKGTQQKDNNATMIPNNNMFYGESQHRMADAQTTPDDDEYAYHEEEENDDYEYEEGYENHSEEGYEDDENHDIEISGDNGKSDKPEEPPPTFDPNAFIQDAEFQISKSKSMVGPGSARSSVAKSSMNYGNLNQQQQVTVVTNTKSQSQSQSQSRVSAAQLSYIAEDEEQIIIDQGSLTIQTKMNGKDRNSTRTSRNTSAAEVAPQAAAAVDSDTVTTRFKSESRHKGQAPLKTDDPSKNSQYRDRGVSHYFQNVDHYDGFEEEWPQETSEERNSAARASAAEADQQQPESEDYLIRSKSIVVATGQKMENKFGSPLVTTPGFRNSVLSSQESTTSQNLISYEKRYANCRQKLVDYGYTMVKVGEESEFKDEIYDHENDFLGYVTDFMDVDQIETEQEHIFQKVYQTSLNPSDADRFRKNSVDHEDFLGLQKTSDNHTGEQKDVDFDHEEFLGVQQQSNQPQRSQTVDHESFIGLQQVEEKTWFNKTDNANQNDASNDIEIQSNEYQVRTGSKSESQKDTSFVMKSKYDDEDLLNLNDNQQDLNLNSNYNKTSTKKDSNSPLRRSDQIRQQQQSAVLDLRNSQEFKDAESVNNTRKLERIRIKHRQKLLRRPPGITDPAILRKYRQSALLKRNLYNSKMRQAFNLYSRGEEVENSFKICTPDVIENTINSNRDKKNLKQQLSNNQSQDKFEKQVGQSNESTVVGDDVDKNEERPSTAISDTADNDSISNYQKLYQQYVQELPLYEKVMLRRVMREQKKAEQKLSKYQWRHGGLKINTFTNPNLMENTFDSVRLMNQLTGSKHLQINDIRDEVMMKYDRHFRDKWGQYLTPTCKKMKQNPLEHSLTPVPLQEEIIYEGISILLKQSFVLNQARKNFDITLKLGERPFDICDRDLWLKARNHHRYGERSAAEDGGPNGTNTFTTVNERLSKNAHLQSRECSAANEDIWDSNEPLAVGEEDPEHDGQIVERDSDIINSSEDDSGQYSDSITSVEDVIEQIERERRGESEEGSGKKEEEQFIKQQCQHLTKEQQNQHRREKRVLQKKLGKKVAKQEESLANAILQMSEHTLLNDNQHSKVGDQRLAEMQRKIRKKMIMSQQKIDTIMMKDEDVKHVNKVLDRKNSLDITKAYLKLHEELNVGATNRHKKGIDPPDYIVALEKDLHKIQPDTSVNELCERLENYEDSIQSLLHLYGNTNKSKRQKTKDNLNLKKNEKSMSPISEEYRTKSGPSGYKDPELEDDLGYSCEVALIDQTVPPHYAGVLERGRRIRRIWENRAKLNQEAAEFERVRAMQQRGSQDWDEDDLRMDQQNLVEISRQSNNPYLNELVNDNIDDVILARDEDRDGIADVDQSDERIIGDVILAESGLLNYQVKNQSQKQQQQNQQQQDPSDNRSRQDFVMRPGTFEWLQFQRNAKTRRPSRQINIGGGFLPVSRSIVSDGAEIYFASGINNHKGVENFQRRNKEEQQRYKKREKEEKEREKRLIRNKKYDGLSKEEQDQIHHLFEGKAIQLIQQQKKNNIIDNEKKRKKSSKSNKDSESKSQTESESDAKKSQRKLSLKQFYSKKSDIRKSSKKSSMHTSGTTVYDEEDLPFASDSESQSNSDSDGSVNSDSDGSRSGSGTGTSKSDNSKSGESDQSGPASKSVSNSSESKSNKSSGNSESASSSPSNRGSAVQAEPRSSNANEAANETDVNDTNNESGNFLNNIFGTNIFYKENIDNLDDDEPKPKAKVSNINKDDKLNDQNQQIDKFIAKLKKSQQPKSPKKTKITNDNLDELHKLKPHFKQSSSSRLPQYQKPNPHYPVSVSPNKHDVNIRSILRPPKPVRQTMSTRGPKSESISASASESILARKLSAVSLTPKPDVINRPKLSRKDEKKIIKEISGKYEIDLDQQYDNHNVNKNSPTISTKQQTGLKTKTQIGSNVVSSPIYKSVSILSTKEERRKSIDEQHDAILQKYMGTQLKQEKIVTTEQKKKKVQDSTNTSKTIIQKTNQQEPKSDKSKKEKKSDTSASKNKSKKAKDEKSSKSKNDKIDKKLKDKNPEDIRAISPIHVISDAISSKFSDLLHNLKDNDQEQLTQRRGSSNSLSRSPKHTRSISPLRIARLDQNLLNHGYVNDTIDLNVSSKPPAQAAIHGDDGQKQNLAAESGDKDNYSNQPNIGIVSKVHDNDSKDYVENKGQYLGSENLVKSESNASEIVKVQNMVSVIDRNQNSKSSSVSPVTQTQTNTIETEYDNDDHSKSLDVISNSYGNASQSLMELNDMILRPEMQTETPILVPAEAATGPDPLNSGAKAQNQMLFYREDKLELEVDSIDINDDSEKSGLNTETDSESEVGQTHNVEDQEKLQLFDKTITKNSTSSRVPKLDLTNVDQYASDSESDLNDNHSKVTDSNDINSKTTDSQSQTGPVLNQHETLTESSVTATECQETAQNQSNQWTDKEWREYYENIIYWQYHNTSNYNTLSKTERQKMRERLEAKRSVQQPGRSAGAGGYTLFACDTVADAMENAKSMESSSSSSSSLEALMPITMAIENLMMKSNQSNDSVQKNLDPISDSPKVYQVNKRFNMAESEQKNVNGDENLNVTKDSHDIGDISESDSVTDKIQNVDASEENNNNDTINSSIVFSEDFDLPSVPVSMSESLPVSTDTLGDAGSENGNKNNGFLNGIIGSLF